MSWRVLLIMICFAALAQAAEPVGLLSMVSGEVKIVRAGQAAALPARTADLLFPGDRVQAGRNSEATFLFCPQSRSAEVAAGSEVEFAAVSISVRKGKLEQEHSVPSCTLPPDLALSAAAKLQSGMLRLRGSALVLRSPSRTAVGSLDPLFRWDPVEDAQSYEIQLRDREEHVLWLQRVTGTEAQPAAGSLHLAWGNKYWWRLTALDGDEAIGESSSYFQVLPSSQAEQVQAAAAHLEELRLANPADNGPLFLMAFLYEENGMLDQAARRYEELSARMGPQGGWVQSRIYDLMNQLGWDRLDSSPAQ